MNAILGKKIGMTQIFTEDGEALAVTLIESDSCTVQRIKTKHCDGYNAIQLRLNNKFVKEVPVVEPKDYSPGQKIEVGIFSPGEFVNVIGTSIGRGFQGGVKRWGWSGGPESHGSMSHRAPGSIGASAFPSRVYKGHHLPGHMGNQRVTLQNLEVIKADKQNHLLVVKGSVPGHKNSYLIVMKSQTKRPKPKKPEQQEEKAKQEKANTGSDKK